MREIVAETRPAPIRIKLILQLNGTYLNSEQAKRLAEQLAPGAVKIIQKFVQVSTHSWSNYCIDSRRKAAVREA